MVDEIRTDLQPPLSAAARRRRRWRRVISSGLTVIAIAVLGGGAWWGLQPLIKKCYGDGVWLGVDGECVGVTDGGYEFPGLEPVERKVKEENQKIVKGEPVVTVAVLLPVPVSEKASSGTLGQIRSQLEGSYLAQHEANSVQDNRKIKLVIANEGSAEQDWEKVVGRLGEMTTDPQPLDAVAGLGVSVQATVKGVHAMAGQELAMVGSVLTADDLNAAGSPRVGGELPGFFRVGASNADEVAALRKFQDDPASGSHPSAMLVYNRDPNDFYTDGLRRDFENSFQGEIGGKERAYDGRTPEETKAQFNVISDDLCGPDAPDTVLYAGRADLLDNFVASLGPNGTCGHQVTVLTGSDAGSLERTQTSGVTVKYAALASPAGLRSAGSGTYPAFETEFLNEGFSFSDLENGWAIMGHDSVAAIDQAVQYVPRKPDGTPLRPREVRGLLGLLTSEKHRVHGVSGEFYFDQETHVPVGQQVHVMELGNAQATDKPLSHYLPSPD